MKNVNIKLVPKFKCKKSNLDDSQSNINNIKIIDNLNDKSKNLIKNECNKNKNIISKEKEKNPIQIKETAINDNNMNTTDVNRENK